MQKAFFTILALVSTYVYFSCSDLDSGIAQGKQLNYDTARIARLDLDSTKEWATPYSTPAVLIQEDFDIIDSLLAQYINQYDSLTVLGLEKRYKNLPMNYRKPEYFIIDLKKYRRQYMPYIDNNHQKIVHINCFCAEKSEWKSTRVYPKREFGNCYFSLKVELSAKTIKEFYINYYVG